jgi:photosystem II stability/assembly factor-like uncharacterized protein
MKRTISPLRLLERIALLLAVALVCAGCGVRAYLPSLTPNPWHLVSLPTEATLSDVAFTSDQNHGWLVGKDTTLLETLDGGETWQPRSLNLDEQKYTFTAVSFARQEGWIVGQPSILLHTTDGGKSWAKIPLSDKLPGSPNTIVALAANQAEMTTDIGAIYQTQDGGKTWKALVQEAVGVVRNISRSPDGQYVAVSSRGNFFSTWQPGQPSWTQHNRTSSRRLQNMGFDLTGRLWLLARGGSIQFANSTDPEDWNSLITPEFSTSWGLLDLAYRTPEEVWVAGGSGNLLFSPDSGKTWQKDRDVENIPSNFYRIVFVSPERGFILGQSGVLLKYQKAV